ncbi:hypothetical protein GWK47_037452 [Chionoecetes opilio]|uniref:Uncharacterized protein n=1 Tax=Chionoecetes opilio TaxID=41210 RepID=A0A8J5CML4_CHIOP|nr:hypothetical protein GWK47_037452 [Chionoecetes opilio]
MSCAASHTRRLNSIHRRALRLVDAADNPAQPESASPLDSLEHRRDVAAFVVFHKAQVQGVPHLAGLRQPPRVLTRSTRTVLTSGYALEVPRSRDSQHQRTFVGRVLRMWTISTANCIHASGFPCEPGVPSVKLSNSLGSIDALLPGDLSKTRRKIWENTRGPPPDPHSPDRVTVTHPHKITRRKKGRPPKRDKTAPTIPETPPGGPGAGVTSTPLLGHLTKERGTTPGALHARKGAVVFLSRVGAAERAMRRRPSEKSFTPLGEGAPRAVV